MNIAYFDTIGGISGDMTLGAFVSAGVRLEDLSAIIPMLGLRGVELSASHVVRSGITAVKVDVVISVQDDRHRHLRDILEMIAASALPGRVKERAEKIFAEVGRAEAKVHNVPLEKVHFHEVGAIDSIVDIVGASYCCELMGIDRAYSSPVKLGSGGFIESAHGKLPLPGPAALEILRGYPVQLTDIPHELTTPTGAAIVRALSSGTLATGEMIVERIGYGAGTREMVEAPNLLRVMIGKLADRRGEDDVVVIETNIDDMNPELFPPLLEELIGHGALDAYLTQVVMKKGRPGIMVTVLVQRDRMDEALGILLGRTTTIGVRTHGVHRVKVEREVVEVETALGRVKAKSIVREGKGELIPEFEECLRISQEKGVALMEVYGVLRAEFVRIMSKNNDLQGSKKADF